LYCVLNNVAGDHLDEVWNALDDILDIMPCNEPWECDLIKLNPTGK
jgi:hypothetical protein